jgi:tetratricopeptide (TPR) repeat protein
MVRLKAKQTGASNLTRNVARIRYALFNFGLNLLWRFKPQNGSRPNSEPLNTENLDEEEATLRGIIQRFPFWRKGRQLLAEQSILRNDIATAYAEAQALRVLSPEGSGSYATALALLGRCYLKRGDGDSALSLLAQASQLRPKDFRIHEDQAAARILIGDKARALETLQSIPATHLSAEGKAALQWLSMQS